MYLNQDNYYIINVPPQEGIKDLLMDCGLIDATYSLNYEIKEEFKEQACCKKSYLRGLFLAAGSIADPEKEYHLEISVNYENYAQELVELFAQFEIDIKLRQRNSNYLLYLKKSDDIIKVLNIIGAHSALLQFESTKVNKEVRNRVNRLVNCETANLNKTLEAARSQLEDIELIDHLEGLDNLSAGLEEIAQLRRNNPYASLRELGEMIDLTKSGVNHRFRRLQKKADKLRKNKLQK
jgi:DNA-binding protein WhiA